MKRKQIPVSSVEAASLWWSNSTNEMAEKILEFILNTEPADEFRIWFLKLFETHHESRCSIEEFAIYFLNYVRNQTDEYTKGCPSPCNTPKKLTESTAASDAVASEIDTTSGGRTIARDLFVGKAESAIKDDLKSPPLAGVESFVQDAPLSSTPSMKVHVHTPMSIRSANSSQHSNSIRSLRSLNESLGDSFSPFNDTTTTANSSRGTQPHDKTRERRSFNSPMCLGDFLTPTTSKQHKHRKSHTDSVDSPTNAPGSGSKDSASKSRPNRGILLSSTAQPITPKSKPTRRVVPTLISSSQSDFTSPAFHSQNNILAVTHEEESDNTRQVLKMQKDELKKVFQVERPVPTNLRALIQERLASPASNVSVRVGVAIQLDRITNRKALDKFVAIYSIILDLNLVTNILAEYAYLVNLINVDAEEYYERYPQMLTKLCEANAKDKDGHKQIATTRESVPGDKEVNDDNDTSEWQLMLLRNINNCVYFGLGVLKLQKHVLRLLDTTSIKVLLDNERLTTLDATIKDDLMTVYAHKMQLESSVAHDSALRMHNSSMKVFYQQEQDTQIHFPSSREFATFKKQRDTFYSILGLWESKHLSPTWDFEQELGRKVRSLLSLMDHPINMAHMAKLFTSQLILSCNFNDASLDLPNVDPSKLSKLSQRLIAPSHFSTNFQFPGNQTFFKDFIIAAEHNVTFIEQLKIIISHELIGMNDSTFETLNLSTADDEQDSKLTREYVVKPETLSNLSVLAKFLGLITARPFIYEFGVNTQVDSRQIELRHKIRPSIDVLDLLRKSMTEQKLVVTLPWIVQFLAMLDAVTLRSEYYRQVFQSLYELYMMTITDSCRESPKLAIRPTSIFIVRSCLGWLFDQPNIPNDYYDYRQNRKPLTLAAIATESTGVQIFVPKHLAHHFQSSEHQVVLNADLSKFDDDRMLMCALQKCSKQFNVDVKYPQSSTVSTFDPLLENVLISACPFLADFRVSIMPKRSSKSVSRTGRYRHITSHHITNEQSSTTTPPSAKREVDTQTKLIEAFLHAQSLSVRRIIECVHESVYSAVIKDFQVEILIPFKKSIMETVDNIRLKERDAVYDELFRVYVDGEQRLLVKWQEFVKAGAMERIKKCFDGHLPHETAGAVRLACINIATQKILARADDWRATHLNGIEIFTKNIQEDVDKVLKKTASSSIQSTHAFEIDLTKRTPWIVFNDLQYRLHIASLTPVQLDYGDIIRMAQEIHLCVNDHRLPETMYKTIGNMTVHLLILLVQNRSDIISKELINQFILIWKSEQFASFVVAPDENDADLNETRMIEAAENNDSAIIMKECLQDGNYLFSSILSPAVLFALQFKPRLCFIILADLLTELVQQNLMTIQFINKQCVKLLRNEWYQVTLSNFAFTVQTVVDNCKRLAKDVADALFLEMLGDLIRDLERV